MVTKYTLNYYTSLDVIPVYNWFKAQEKNDLRFLKIRNTGKGCLPAFFIDVYEKLVFQFDKLDLTEIRKQHKEAYFRAKYYQTKKFEFLNKANELKFELELSEKRHRKPMKLSEFMNFIEVSTNNIGKLNAFELSTKRAFELFDLANEMNKQKTKLNNNKHGIN